MVHALGLSSSCFFYLLLPYVSEAHHLNKDEFRGRFAVFGLVVPSRTPHHQFVSSQLCRVNFHKTPPKNMSERPLPTPASKSSASSAKQAAAVSPSSKGTVPTDKVGVMRIVNMMVGGTLASLGLDGCCCCGGGQSQPLELKLCTIGNKRGPYVKGRGLLEWCKDQEYRLPFKANVENVSILTEAMMQHEVLIKAELVDKENKKIRPIKAKGPNVFKPGDFYVWHYEGDQTKRNVLMTLIVCVVFFFCLMPAWPRFMKIGVWYSSVTLLLILVGFTVFRMLLWLIVWISSGWHLTIFPYIFIDGIPITDAFIPWGPAIPAWSSGGSWYQDELDSMRYYRVGALVACIGISFWVYSQPTEFDDYMSATKGFTDDLYSGNLLSDMSNADKVNIDKPKYQSLADILFEEAENAAEADKEEAATVATEGAKKKTPSLEELENMDTEGEDEEETEEEEAARMLREIQEEEDAVEGTH